MIVLDASVLIAHLIDADAHAQRAWDLLDTDDELAIHPITLTESLVGPVRVGREHEAVATVVRLGIEQLEPRPDEPYALARLRAETRLKLPDCCVLATAERTGAQLGTFDARLAAIARERGVAVLS